MTDVNGVHCFEVGQVVRRTAGFGLRTSGFGLRSELDTEFEVVRQLPPDDSDFFYRIRNTAEGFERVVSESEIVDAKDASAPVAQ